MFLPFCQFCPILANFPFNLSNSDHSVQFWPIFQLTSCFVIPGLLMNPANSLKQRIKRRRHDATTPSPEALGVLHLGDLGLRTEHLGVLPGRGDVRPGAVPGSHSDERGRWLRFQGCFRIQRFERSDFLWFSCHENPRAFFSVKQSAASILCESC